MSYQNLSLYSAVLPPRDLKKKENTPMYNGDDLESVEAFIQANNY